MSPPKTRRSSPEGSDELLQTTGSLDKLVDTLGRMRGAALKVGQMLSIQDSDVLPKEWNDVLVRLQNQAHYIPFQPRLERVMQQELGMNWRSLFMDFSEVPVAAASIGQVHRATLQSSDTPGVKHVAVKIQYPGIDKSIKSDLAQLKILLGLSAFRLLPRGLYLDNTIKVAQRELERELDYVNEAEAMKWFHNALNDEHVDNQHRVGLTVPRIIETASSKRVLTTEWMDGIPFGKLDRENTSQKLRDQIGEAILRLALRELFEFKKMQTDPNWSNFLYNPEKRKIVLLDFGATRNFEETFTEPYRQLLVAAAMKDESKSLELSQNLGFLTGDETQVMNQAHLSSLFTLARPFMGFENDSLPELYDFGSREITEHVRSQIPIMLKYRLTPPPDESYTLHRKLSGAFLLCQKLGSRVPTRRLFRDIVVRQ